jgi:hypothetical protein
MCWQNIVLAPIEKGRTRLQIIVTASNELIWRLRFRSYQMCWLPPTPPPPPLPFEIQTRLLTSMGEADVLTNVMVTVVIITGAWRPTRASMVSARNAHCTSQSLQPMNQPPVSGVCEQTNRERPTRQTKRGTDRTDCETANQPPVSGVCEQTNRERPTR